ncbi:MAG: imidazolonepropionase-like amidohydrolase [Pseudohongiellaceae bacterium]|jgi:imidazolonepropionase-like amidohydrolase
MIILSNIAKLYDGSSAESESISTGVDLFLDGGKIAQQRPHDSELSVGSEHTRIDCSGLTVTPGLIDCHGHITVLGLDAGSIDLMNTGESMVWVEKVLHTTLVDGGVTTMRDIGGATHMMKRLVDSGAMIGPRLKIAICMLSSTGGHADFRGVDRCHAQLSRLWPEGPGRPSSIVDGPWAARKRVREIAACGADLIKICASPGVASPGDALEHRDLHPAEVEAICDEAHARGLRVAAHAHSRSGIKQAITAGVDDLQHISFMDEALVELAHERGCTVTPTSWVMSALQSAVGLSDFVMDKVKQVAEVHAQATAYAHSGGLKILAGTDPVLPGMHGRNYMELVALMGEGMSSLSSWYSATGLAAEGIGQDDTGTVKEGQRADLLICSEDVVSDPAALDRGALLEVVKDGEGYRNGLPGLPQRNYGRSITGLLNPDELRP